MFVKVYENIEIRKMIRRSWVKLEITKVKLNPEQAVLSCCDAVVRGVQMVAFPYLEQCFSGEGTECGISPSFNLASS